MSVKNTIPTFSLCLDIDNCWDVSNQTSKQTVGASYAFIYQMIIGFILYTSPPIMRYLCPSKKLARLGITGFIIHLLLAISNWIHNAIKFIFRCSYPPKFSLITETRMHTNFIKASTSSFVFFSHICF